MRNKHICKALFIVAVLSLLLAACAPSPGGTQPAAPPTPGSVIEDTIKTEYAGSSLKTGVFFVALALIISGAVFWLLNWWREKEITIGIKVASALATFVILILVFAAAGSYITVDAGQVGVLVRQGKAIATLSPGPHWITPYWDSIVLFPAYDWTYATMSNPDSQGNEDYRDWPVDMIAKDGVHVELKYSIQGRIDPRKAISVYEDFGTLVNAISQAVKHPSRIYVRQMVQDYTADSLVIALDDASGDAQGMMQPIMEKAGLVMIRFGFRKPTLGIGGAYESELDSRRVAEKQALTEEAKVEINKQQALQAQEQAKGEAYQTIERAKGEAERVKLAVDAKAYELITEAGAQSEAIKVVSEALTNSPLYLQFYQLQAWEKGGSQVPLAVGGGTFTWLPLPSVQSAVPTGPPTESSASP